MATDQEKRLQKIRDLIAQGDQAGLDKLITKYKNYLSKGYQGFFRRRLSEQDIEDFTVALLYAETGRHPSEWADLARGGYEYASQALQGNDEAAGHNLRQKTGHLREEFQNEHSLQQIILQTGERLCQGELTAPGALKQHFYRETRADRIEHALEEQVAELSHYKEEMERCIKQIAEVLHCAPGNARDIFNYLRKDHNIEDSAYAVHQQLISHFARILQDKAVQAEIIRLGGQVNESDSDRLVVHLVAAIEHKSRDNSGKVRQLEESLVKYKEALKTLEALSQELQHTKNHQDAETALVKFRVQQETAFTSHIQLLQQKEQDLADSVAVMQTIRVLRNTMELPLQGDALVAKKEELTAAIAALDEQLKGLQRGSREHRNVGDRKRELRRQLVECGQPNAHGRSLIQKLMVFKRRIIELATSIKDEGTNAPLVQQLERAIREYQETAAALTEGVRQLDRQVQKANELNVVCAEDEASVQQLHTMREELSSLSRSVHGEVLSRCRSPASVLIGSASPTSASLPTSASATADASAKDDKSASNGTGGPARRHSKSS